MGHPGQHPARGRTTPEGENPVSELPELMKAAHITTIRRYERWCDVAKDLEQ